MNERSTDFLLQEYLDGRLSREDRSAFEERLAREPDLARRVAEYEEIRQALGEDAPEPSPGFYTRVRARFVESAVRERRGSFRWLSWEVTGLTAAAAIAVALFLPALMRKDEPFRGQSEVPSMQRAPKELDGGEMQPKGRLTEPSERFRPAPSSLADEDLAAAGSADSESPAPMESRAPLPEPMPERGLAEKQARETAKRSAVGDKKAEAGRRIAEDRVDAPAAAPLAREAFAAEPTRRIDGVALPAAVVGLGESLVVDDDDGWRRLVATAASDAVTARSTETPRPRAVLVGPGVACAGSSVIETADGYVILLFIGGKSASPGGCAFFLPDDGRGITVREVEGSPDE